MQRSQRVGRRAHARANAIEITYRWVDGGADSQLRLTPGLRRAESTNDHGVVIDRLINRWIGERSDFLAARRMPRVGDRIIVGGDEYLVTHPGGGREVELRDPYGESLSINTVMSKVLDGPPPEPPPGPPVVELQKAYGNSLGISYGNGYNVAYGGA